MPTPHLKTLLFFLLLTTSCTTIAELNEEQEAKINTALTPLTRSYRYEVSRAELLDPVLAQVNSEFAAEQQHQKDDDRIPDSQHIARQSVRIVADACSKAELLAAPYLDHALITNVVVAERTDEIKPSEETPAVDKNRDPPPPQEVAEARTCHQPIRIEGPRSNYFLYNAGSHRSRVLVRDMDDYLKRVPQAEYRLIRRVNLPQAEAIRRKLAESNPPISL